MPHFFLLAELKLDYITNYRIIEFFNMLGIQTTSLRNKCL